MGTTASYNQESDEPCYNPRMTRAQALARRAAGTLRENCVVVITDGPTIGTTGNTSPTEIELNPVSPTELGLTARVHTTFDNSAWHGTYDIDLGVQGSITKLTDSSGNTAMDVDANSPTVHTQFPWHLGSTLGVGLWRDNYAEDAVFTAVDDTVGRIVQGNKFINTTSMDFTGWTAGSMNDNEIVGGGIHHITLSGTWTRSLIHQSAANFTANSTLTEARLLNGGNVSSTGTSQVTISTSTVEGATVRNDSSNGAITVQGGSHIYNGAQVLNDAGSFKVININGSDFYGSFVVRGQGGTVAKSISISVCQCYGIGGGFTETLLIKGDASASIGFSEIDQSGGQISADGTATIQWSHVKWLNGSTCTFGPLTTNNQWSSSIFDACFVNIQGPGDTNFSTAISQTVATAFTLTTVAATAQDVQIQSTFINNFTVESTGPAGLLIDLGCRLGGLGRITQSRTVAPTGSFNDRISQCVIDEGGRILIASTVGTVNTHNIARSHIHGSSLAAPQGRLEINGTSDGVFVDACDIAGSVVLTDVPFGALDGPTSFHNNHVDPSCSITYTAGDAVRKQIRDNHVEGNSSSLVLSGLTGSAGAALADVFSCRIANQSSLTVSGARVAGFPVRSVIVENGSTVTIPANGSALQVALWNNADLDTGAFVQFDSSITGPIAKVATASNNGALANAAFDNWV